MTREFFFIPGVRLLIAPARGSTRRRAALVRGSRRYDLGTPTDPDLDFIRALARQPLDRDSAHAREFADLIGRLVELGLVGEVVHEDGAARFRRVPTREQPQRGAMPRSVRLSRFTQLTRTDGRVTLAAPIGTCTFDVYDADLLAGVFAEEVPTTGEESLAVLGRMLFESGLAVADDEACDPSALWSPHELAFHVGSRRHRAAVLGENFGSAPPRISTKAMLRPALGEGVSLPPDAEASEVGTTTLADAIRRRRSTRHYDEDHPITLHQLAVMLRAVRGGHGDGTLPAAHRPYPSGGALYEIDVYVAVRACAGLGPGTYLYDGDADALRSVGTPTATSVLIRDTAQAMAGEQLPQVVLVLAARFGALMGKYREMGYSLILKHVGVVMELGYLVAAAEGVGICALGSGDPERFAAVTGLDPLVVSSVGEISLGSLPEPLGPTA